MPLWTEWLPKSHPAPNAPQQSIEAVLSDEYKDAGYWGRHYSTVRLTLGTFFMTATAAVAWKNWESPEPYLKTIATVMAVTGSVLFGYFTHMTFKEMNRQRDIYNAYRRAILAPGDLKQVPQHRWYREPSGGFILGAYLIGFFWFVYWFGPKPTSAGDPSQLSIEVKVGNADPVSLKVPVTVSSVKVVDPPKK